MGTPRFLEDPRAHALLSNPGGTGRVRPSRRAGAAFRLGKGVGSRHKKRFGAQSHGLCTRCLRFAARDCSPSTQDSLPAVGQTLPDGIGYPLGPYARFSRSSHSTPPCPGFAWRTAQSFWQTAKASSRGRDVRPGPAVWSAVARPGGTMTPLFLPPRLPSKPKRCRRPDGAGHRTPQGPAAARDCFPHKVFPPAMKSCHTRDWLRTCPPVRCLWPFQSPPALPPPRGVG